MTHRQEPPFAVQVELVEGCNLRCSFCGLNGIREPKNHNFKFMERDVIVSLFKQMSELSWNPRVEFAMHGEPTMHPSVCEMVALAREFAPRLQLMMTSNGGGLMAKPGPRQRVLDLFDAGLNVLALDDYEGVKFVSRVRETFADAELYDNGKTYADFGEVQVYEYPADKRGSPHARRPLDDRVLIFIQAINIAKDGNHSLLNNHAGAGAPLNDSQRGRRCAKPFRELSVRWNGEVAVCCNDWRGFYKCGSVVADGLEAVWNGAAMEAARVKLYHGQRDFGPCKGCDAVSYRVGLLPDKFGKESMPKPSAKTRDALRAAVAGKPLTAPVLRPWEAA